MEDKVQVCQQRPPRADLMGFRVRSSYLFPTLVVGAQVKAECMMLAGGREKVLGRSCWLCSGSQSGSILPGCWVQFSQTPGGEIISTMHKKIAGFGICFEAFAGRLSKEA